MSQRCIDGVTVYRLNTFVYIMCFVYVQSVILYRLLPRITVSCTFFHLRDLHAYVELLDNFGITVTATGELCAVHLSMLNFAPLEPKQTELN